MSASSTSICDEKLWEPVEGKEEASMRGLDVRCFSSMGYGGSVGREDRGDSAAAEEKVSILCKYVGMKGRRE